MRRFSVAVTPWRWMDAARPSNGRLGRRASGLTQLVRRETGFWPALLVLACGGPPRFATAGAFSATGRCGADPSDTPQPVGESDGFYDVGVLVSIEDGRLVAVEYEEGATVSGKRELAATPVVAGQWQEIEVPLTHDSTRENRDFVERRVRIFSDGPMGSARVAFRVEGERMQIRLNGGPAVTAECVWE